MLAVRPAEAELVVVGLVEELAREERPIRPLLQLDGIDAALLGRLDQLLGLVQLALVVVADLRDDVAVAAVVDLDAVDPELPALALAHRSDATRGSRRPRSRPPRAGARARRR